MPSIHPWHAPRIAAMIAYRPVSYPMSSCRHPLTIALIILLALLLAAVAVTQLWVRYVERTYPPQGRFITVDRQRFHVLEQGQGQPIVLIHGASTSARDYYPGLLQTLSKTHRVIAMDRPGHGYSDRHPRGVRKPVWPSPAGQAAALRQVLHSLAVYRPVLVGHSWGAAVTLAYLLDYPDDVAGGVLLGGVSHPWEGSVASYNRIVGLPVLGDLFVNTVLLPFGWFAQPAGLRRVFSPNRVPDRYLDNTGLRLSLRPRVFQHNAEDLGKLSAFLATQAPRYEHIKTPLLLIHGTEDTVVPAADHPERLIKAVPQAHYVPLPGIGHAPHYAAPETVLQLILAFSRQVHGPIPNGAAGPERSVHNLSESAPDRSSTANTQPCSPLP